MTEFDHVSRDVSRPATAIGHHGGQIHAGHALVDQHHRSQRLQLEQRGG